MTTAPRAKFPLDHLDFLLGNPGPNLLACLVVHSLERKKHIEKAWEEQKTHIQEGDSRKDDISFSITKYTALQLEVSIYSYQY